ncbi:MAG TPA: hypothetical protein V6C95_06095 [Coleofasciculaceae cyanobacterium]
MNFTQNSNNVHPLLLPKKSKSASLTQDEVAAIIRLAQSYGLSEAATAKLLLAFRKRKKGLH